MMSQYNAPTVRRSGGELNVYTGLLCVATLVLLAGVILLAMNNISHSRDPVRSTPGGVLTLVE